MREGARIVVEDWLRIGRGERLAIVTDELHTIEAEEMRIQAEAAGALPFVVSVPSSSPQSGKSFDERRIASLDVDAIIGATHYSIMTTRVIRDVVRSGARFLSIPLSTHGGISLLERDFMTMDVEEAGKMGSRILSLFVGAREVRVSTEAGTDLRLCIEGRKGSVFHGLCHRPGISTSASFEFSISVIEDETCGELVLDGSMGYIGLVERTVRILFDRGRIVAIEDNRSGRDLASYLVGFQDERMYVAGELGIGLNKKAFCVGHSYIEDESAYGTFHVGIGRNLALGGAHDANGHFDLVSFAPDIEVDGTLIIEGGVLI
jgi:hypothetical protein